LSIKEGKVKAFLLAAGTGSRLRPLTDTVPKCLVPIGGKPLLEYWLEALYEAGIEEALINTHWLHHKVVQYAEQWDQSKVILQTVYEPKLLGSAGTIVENADWAEDTAEILIIYADNYPNMDLRDILDFHLNHDKEITLGVFKSPIPEKCGIIEVGANGEPVSFVEKPEFPKSDLAAAGLYLFSSRVLGTIAEMQRHAGIPYDLGFHVFPKLIREAAVYILKKPIIDIGTPEAYEGLCKSIPADK